MWIRLHESVDSNKCGAILAVITCSVMSGLYEPTDGMEWKGERRIGGLAVVRVGGGLWW